MELFFFYVYIIDEGNNLIMFVGNEIRLGEGGIVVWIVMWRSNVVRVVLCINVVVVVYMVILSIWRFGLECSFFLNLIVVVFLILGLGCNLVFFVFVFDGFGY